MTVANAHSTLIARASLGLPTPYVAPHGKLETLMAKIFADVFGIDQVGANDDFFDIGGDSLLAETLTMEITQQTGCEFQMSSLLEFCSPRKIAAALPTSESGKDAAKAPVVAEAKRPPIFAVHGRDGFMLPKPAFLQALGGQKLRMFELPGIRSGRCFKRIEAIAEVYLNQLITEYPQGPILLCGFCWGSMIALEMAAQLEEMGRPITMLVLIDPNVPDNVVVNYKRRKGTPVEWTPYLTSGGWLKQQAWRLAWELVCLLALGRRTDGCQDEDFGDERLRRVRELIYRYKHLRHRWLGRGNYPDLRLSIGARAALNAAHLHYRPRPFQGPAAILSSLERRPMFEDPSHIWAELLPHKRIYQMAERHKEMGEAGIRAESAHLMQSLFDAALRGMDPSLIEWDGPSASQLDSKQDALDVSARASARPGVQTLTGGLNSS